jgi:hypothetical protein
MTCSPLVKKAIVALVILVVCAGVLGVLWKRDTPPQVAPKVARTVEAQRAVDTAIKTIYARRKSNDERIAKVAQEARDTVSSLDANAVVAELNVLLDELRQRKP